jgi:hypothetical protein
VRLRRTKIEHAFVSVPMNGNVMERDPEDAAKFRVNGEKVFELTKTMRTNAGILCAQETEPLNPPLAGCAAALRTAGSLVQGLF